MKSDLKKFLVLSEVDTDQDGIFELEDCDDQDPNIRVGAEGEACEALDYL